MHSSVCRIADDARLHYLRMSACSCHPAVDMNIGFGRFFSKGREHVELFVEKGVEIDW